MIGITFILHNPKLLIFAIIYQNISLIYYREEKLEIKKEWYKDNLPIKSNDEHAVSVLGQFLKGDSKVIGLIGDYGSGKSSIIKALKEKNRSKSFYILSVPNYLDFEEENIDSSKINDKQNITVQIEKNKKTEKYSLEKSDNNALKQNVKLEVRKAITMQLLSKYECNEDFDREKKKLKDNTIGYLRKREKFILLLIISIPVLLTVVGSFDFFHSFSNLIIIFSLLIQVVLIIYIIYFIKKRLKEDKKEYQIFTEIKSLIQMYVGSKTERTSDINSIKKRLYIHTFEKVKVIDYIAVVIFILSILLLNTYSFVMNESEGIKSNHSHLNDSIQFVADKQILILAIIVVLMVFAITRLTYLTMNFLKNAKLSDIGVSNLKIKQKLSDTYIDYDLETIVALIETKAKSSTRDIVIVIEDLDRYKSKEIFQEIIHIANSCSSAKFIIPVKSEMFEDEVEQSKYFDSQYSVLPINDKLSLYQYIEDVFRRQKQVEVNSLILRYTSPYIEDVRTFHTIYNMYLTLLENYLKIEENPDIRMKSLIYTIAVLRTLLPDEMKNTGKDRTDFFKFIEDLFNKKKLESKLKHTAEVELYNVESQLKKLNDEIASNNNEIHEKIKINDKEVLELLNYSLASFLSDKTNKWVTTSSGQKTTQNIKQNIINNSLFSAEEIKQIADQFPNDQFEVDRLEILFDDGKVEILKENNVALEKSIDELKLKFEHLKNKMLIIENDSRIYSPSEMINRYELDEYINEVFETYIPIEKKDLNKYKELICSLIIERYLTEDCGKIISILEKDEKALNLRKFKYEISDVIKNYDYLYDTELGFEINQNFIDIFSTNEYKKGKFVREEIINYLVMNTDKKENKLKLHNILDQIISIVDTSQNFDFTSDIVEVFDDNKINIVKLFDSLYLNYKQRNLNKVEMIAACKIIKIYYLCQRNIPEVMVHTIVKYISEQYNFEIINDKLIWQYIDYNLSLIDDNIFLKLLDVFMDDRFKTTEFIKVISIYLKKLDNIGIEENTKYEKLLVTRNLYLYNNENVKYCMSRHTLFEKYIIDTDENFISYICTNKVDNVVTAKNTIYKKALIKENIDNLMNFCNTYSFKILNLNELNDEIAKKIIEEKMYLTNDTNKLYLIGKNNYKELLDNFNLEHESLPITKEVANEIVKYIDNNELEEKCINNFIVNIDYQYDVANITNSDLLEKLIEANRVLATAENYKAIDELAPTKKITYIQSVGVEELISFGLETFEYDDLLNQLYNNDNYDYVNELYLRLDQSEFNIFNHNLNVDVNVQILLNNEIEEDKVMDEFDKYNHKTIQKTFRNNLLEKSVSKYLLYFNPRFSDLDKVAPYLNNNHSEEERLYIVIAMVKESEISNIEEVIKVMQLLEIWTYFEFPERSRGLARNINVELEIEGKLFEEFCDILVGFNYLSKYDRNTKEIYRKIRR